MADFQGNQPEIQSTTRQERREIQRAQKQHEADRRRQKTITGRVILWSCVAVALFGIGWLAWQTAQHTPATAGGMLAVPVGGSDHSSGPSDAPVTLVEYADFQCPGCAAFQPVLQSMLAEPAFAGKVRFVYRNFPLTSIHQNAQAAARAAEAAALQGKFWEMHEAIYAGQADWSARTTASAQEIFSGYARTLGLDVPQWTADMKSSAVTEKIDADVAGALQSSVDSTPTFFVNGSFIDIFSHSDVVGALRQALTDALNANP